MRVAGTEPALGEREAIRQALARALERSDEPLELTDPMYDGTMHRTTLASLRRRLATLEPVHIGFDYSSWTREVDALLQNDRPPPPAPAPPIAADAPPFRPSSELGNAPEIDFGRQRRLSDLWHAAVLGAAGVTVAFIIGLSAYLLASPETQQWLKRAETWVHGKL